MIEIIRSKLYDINGVFKLSILTSPLFIFGLLFKLFAATIFAASNFTNLFIPFVKYFSLSNFADPYYYFFNLGILEVFPYPKLMLYIMAAPGLILEPLLTNSITTITRADLLTYHLPILLADVTILLILSRWIKNKPRELLIFYWLSPILIYINYIHSQLDAIPMALVFVWLYFLFKERWTLSFLFLGAAIATKFHIIILLPFVLLYVWRQCQQISVLAKGIISVLGVFVLVNLPNLFTNAFQKIVFHNREQGKIFDFQLPFGDDSLLYIIPMAFVVLFLHSLTYKHFNRDTFVMFLGFAFGILVLFITPMPGWYFWVLPFLIYFYVKYGKYAKIQLTILTVSYFSYFAFSPNTDFLAIFQLISPSIASMPTPYEVLITLGYDARFVSNVFLSILQATLLVNVIWLYRRGVEVSHKNKLYNLPYLIGVAGDSGSGKSTLAQLITGIFSKSKVALVEGDAMHKWERGDEMWKKFTHLNPQANALHADLENALSLSQGNTIYRRHYDHHTGKFTAPEKLTSKKLIIFEGLHSFYLSHMQRALDLKIFIQPEEQLRIHWKLCRDMNERGYTKDNVLAQLQKRQSDSEKYISIQEKYADITISLKAKEDLRESVGLEMDLDLYLEIRCDNTINIEPLLNELSRHTNIENYFSENSHYTRIHGKIDQSEVEKISYLLIPELYDIITDEPDWESDYSGVIQLFVCYYIFQSLKLNRHD